MITLIGHGYVGQHIHKELVSQGLNYEWISHKEFLSQHHYGCLSDSTAIINAAGYTGSPNVDACELHKQDTIDGNVLWPLHLEYQFHIIKRLHHYHCNW